MNTVGRIFLVLNLLLAGTFVGFAGTFLKNQDNYKAQLTTAIEQHDETVKNLNGEITTQRTKIQNLDRLVQTTEARLSATTNQYNNEKSENERLSAQLGEIEANYRSLQSNAATMAEKITAAFNQGDEAFKLAVASQKDKDEAVREKDQAVADLRDANRTIAGLTDDKTNLLAQVSSLRAEGREKDILIAAANRLGFTPLNAQPSMNGIVTMAEGDLVTVQVNDNPSDMPIKPGYQFAIYNEGTYLGDMRVNSVQDNYAFGKIIARAENASIKAGDKASTDIQR